MAVIGGESCFEKNAFEDTENPHPPTKTRLSVKEYLGKYSRNRKNFCFILKLFLRPILFHGKLSFDHLTYFKLYGNLTESMFKHNWSFLHLLDVELRPIYSFHMFYSSNSTT